MDSKNAKLEYEVSLLTKQKDQLTQELRNMEKKLDMSQREEERHADEERHLRKDLARLTYANEELNDQVRRLKKKGDSSKPKKHAEESSTDSIKMQRLAEIERKLEALVKMQKGVARALDVNQTHNDSRSNAEPAPEELPNDDTANGKQSMEQIEEESADPEDMLRHLTTQILEKDELRNANIAHMFKLDQIQLHDKSKEYKNLLKAMGALYFANKYSKLVGPLFSHWKEQLRERCQVAEGQPEPEQDQYQHREQEPEPDAEADPDQNDNNQEEARDQKAEGDLQPVRGGTESDPGPLNALDDGQNEIVEENAVEEVEGKMQEAVEVEGEDVGPGMVQDRYQDEQEQESASIPQNSSKPGMEIDTALANREAAELISELNVDTNKEHSADSGNGSGSGPDRGSKEGQQPHNDLIHVDDRGEGEWNDQEEAEGSEDSVDMARNDRLELVDDFQDVKQPKGRAKSDRDADEYFNGPLDEGLNNE